MRDENIEVLREIQKRHLKMFRQIVAATKTMQHAKDTTATLSSLLSRLKREED